MQTVAPALQDRTLTELDHARLKRLLARGEAEQSRDGPNPIFAVLDDAELVRSHDVPPNVVTMYSRVLVEEQLSGRRQILTLCYPQEAQPSEGFVSVLSPIGASLLGLRKGDIAMWSSPDGERLHAQVVELLFQPEATGDYTL